MDERILTSDSGRPGQFSETPTTFARRGPIFGFWESPVKSEKCFFHETISWINDTDSSRYNKNQDERIGRGDGIR